jgi:hypothetical protein
VLFSILLENAVPFLCYSFKWWGSGTFRVFWTQGSSWHSDDKQDLNSARGDLPNSFLVTLDLLSS